MWDAPGDASVDIENQTPAFLQTPRDHRSPKPTAGVFFNGVLVQANATINGHQYVLNANVDNTNNYSLAWMATVDRGLGRLLRHLSGW